MSASTRRVHAVLGAQQQQLALGQVFGFTAVTCSARRSR